MAVSKHDALGTNGHKLGVSNQLSEHVLMGLVVIQRHEQPVNGISMNGHPNNAYRAIQGTSQEFIYRSISKVHFRPSASKKLWANM
jgi:hypothetical protein